MKRVLIFSLTYYPFIGGAEVALKEITDRIPASEIEFDSITLRFDRSLPRFEHKGNISIHRIGFAIQHPTMADLSRAPLELNKYLFPFLAFWKAARLQKKKPYDAIWSMMANYAGFAGLFFKWLYPQVPFLLTLQEGDPIEHIKRRVRFVYPLFTRIFTKADSIQAISNYLADFARSMGFKGQIEVIPNAVNTKLFSAKHSAEEIVTLRHQLGIPTGATILVTTSRLVEKNAVDDVLRALPLLPKVYFVILGTGADDWSLKLLTHELDISERAIFVGQVAHADIPKYLHSADIFIRPSLSEGMGNSFVEAMAAGIPVIATPVGGIVDFLFDPEKNPNKQPTGLFCEVRDPESIARQVKRLIKDPELRKSLTENAHKLVVEQYDWNLIARDMGYQVFAKLFK